MYLRTSLAGIPTRKPEAIFTALDMLVRVEGVVRKKMPFVADGCARPSQHAQRRINPVATAFMALSSKRDWLSRAIGFDSRFCLESGDGSLGIFSDVLVGVLEQRLEEWDLVFVAENGKRAAGVANEQRMGAFKKGGDLGDGLGGVEAAQGFQGGIGFALIVAFKHNADGFEVIMVNRSVESAEDAGGFLAHGGAVVGEKFSDGKKHVGVGRSFFLDVVEGIHDFPRIAGGEVSEPFLICRR